MASDGKWSWDQISWDQKWVFSGDQKNNHEIESPFLGEIESFNNIWQFCSGGQHFDQEIKSYNKL
jgi:hypothetical protein